MISRELFHRVRRIELRGSRLVDELFAGQYRSAFKGSGIEFEEVRPYQPGDDVRTIDWKVTARSQAPQVKLFREERDLTIHLLVDVSGSQFFGSTNQTKHQLAVEMSAILAFAAVRNNDRVGLTMFSDRIEKTVREAVGLRHALRLVRDLLAIEPVERGTNLAMAVREFTRTHRRPSVLFIISDFLCAAYQSALRLAARKHDVVPVVLRDRRETDLPPGGLVRVSDPETGQRFVLDAFSPRQRRQYRELASAHAKERTQQFRQLHLDWLELDTGDDIFPALCRFLERRAKRR